MPNVIPSIEPMGIRPQFKRVKPYLESYRRGFDETKYQRKLANLRRYAEEGPGFVYGEYEGDPLVFDSATAFLELIGVYWVTRWLAIQAALGGALDWHLQWQRAVAYGHWAYRMEFAHEGAVRTFKNIVGNVADCLVLGWQNLATELARRTYRGLDVERFFFDYDEETHPRTQAFVLRLVADWQEWPQRKWQKWVFDEPIFNTLIEHWRTPDPNALRPLLLAACDRHTHESKPGGSASSNDISNDAFSYDPFEVLAVMKLRQLQGLPNPVVDHLLMNTVLGKLPQPVTPYSDALLEGVIAKALLEHPDL